MKLSSNFSLRELTKSQTAERKGIDNTPTEEHLENLKHVHEDVEKLGGKIDQIYWVLLTVAGTAVVFVLERMFT